MRTGKKGKDLIKFYESLHDGDLKMIGLQPKMCPSGIWTEGYGRAMRFKNGKFVKGIENKEYAFKNATINTIKEAEKALDEDLKVFEVIVESKLNVPVTQNQFDALVSHTYNTGGSSTLFDLVNKNLDTPVENWFKTRYITSNGKVLQGLINRRKAESDLFFS